MTAMQSIEGLDSWLAWAARAGAAHHSSLQSWLRCATAAYRTLNACTEGRTDAAAALLTRCTERVLLQLLKEHSGGWAAGPVDVGGTRLLLEFRRVPQVVQAPVRLRLASDLSMAAFGGQRYGYPGFGVPLATLSSYGGTSPQAMLQPHSGAFRNLTSWIEPDLRDPHGPLRLVLADPQRTPNVSVGGCTLTLARDTSAAYAWAMQVSNLARKGVWGLLGGRQIRDRVGVFLLDDYDPAKRPLLMIHGLGSIPLIWAHLTNAVWGSDDLRARYQVWQVVYETDLPLLAARSRIHEYLQEAWNVLDPGETAPARTQMVMVGHSLGGVIARLLCVDSGEGLWNAAFAVPPEALMASPSDLDKATSVFRFAAHPGIARAVFLAAPHRGVSMAIELDHLSSLLIPRRAPEVLALRRIARANPGAIQPTMRRALLQGWINSVATLQADHPVRMATELLLPPKNVQYHTIAGVKAGLGKQTDGMVPLDSAIIPGAESSLVVGGSHHLYDSPEVIAEVVRILRE